MCYKNTSNRPVFRISGITDVCVTENGIGQVEKEQTLDFEFPSPNLPSPRADQSICVTSICMHRRLSSRHADQKLVWCQTVKSHSAILQQQSRWGLPLGLGLLLLFVRGSGVGCDCELVMMEKGQIQIVCFGWLCRLHHSSHFFFSFFFFFFE